MSKNNLPITILGGNKRDEEMFTTERQYSSVKLSPRATWNMEAFKERKTTKPTQLFLSLCCFDWAFFRVKSNMCVTFTNSCQSTFCLMYAKMWLSLFDRICWWWRSRWKVEHLYITMSCWHYIHLTLQSSHILKPVSVCLNLFFMMI